MLHAEIMRAAIEGARTFAQMDELSRQLWRGHGAGALSDGGAQGLAEHLHGRRSAIREGMRPLPIPGVVGSGLAGSGLVVRRASLFPPRKIPRSPDRIASRDRRRLLACSGPLPPRLAARFTEGQRAVLRIVADAVAEAGLCDLCLDAIAARAGVCRRLAQGALRLAAGDGLLTIEERRYPGRRNAPNLVRIVSQDWQAWIKRGVKRRRTDPAPPTEPRPEPKPTGCKALHATEKSLSHPGKTEHRPGVPALPISGAVTPGAAAHQTQARLLNPPTGEPVREGCGNQIGTPM
ncbi:hypothetical protein [Methylobacterium sp.]|uniref:hypothetical protein n=1 Tax=Methylobacterium sp. TaxID=409 RepID=UPI0025E46073|nr:hypothetical protein [Methylobacterium sp.]MBY0257403.1 hypothetical protein [Methylobacterium sp.]